MDGPLRGRQNRERYLVLGSRRHPQRVEGTGRRHPAPELGIQGPERPGSKPGRPRQPPKICRRRRLDRLELRGGVRGDLEAVSVRSPRDERDRLDGRHEILRLGAEVAALGELPEVGRPREPDGARDLDLARVVGSLGEEPGSELFVQIAKVRSGGGRRFLGVEPFVDRKSTRLNSSHSSISYAVFCLKKKKN